MKIAGGENQKCENHKLHFAGQPGNLSASTWRCECGKWQSTTPAVGPYGKTTAKARIAQVQMAHGKHVKFAK